MPKKDHRLNNSIKEQLSQLPNEPGVYFFKNKDGDIIYIGKASNLKRRVSSYFNRKHLDYKTPLLVQNIQSLEYLQTNSEIEALFLEAEYIKRHKPLYNVELKDDKNFIYIKIDLNEDFPSINLVRRPTDDRARYYGPYVSGYQVRQALRYLRYIFPYYSKSKKKHSSKLEYQIGVIPQPDITKAQYRSNIRKLMLIFEGKSSYIVKQLESEMNKLAKAKNYEQATIIRNQYLALKGLSTKIVFGREESIDLKLDSALSELTNALKLNAIPRRIECYDISNFAGGDAVSSMIVFTDGVPDQKEYRHFNMRSLGPNDFAMMQETLRRRFSSRNKKWPKPNLIIVDGGKGQLSSAQKSLQESSVSVPIVGLAKRYETIIMSSDDDSTKYKEINFADNSSVLHLIQRIRDEAHRFAITYHRLIRNKRTKESLLDSIEGIGPATRKKLIKKFGSVVNIKMATKSELSEVVGESKAASILEKIQSTKTTK